MRRAGEPIEEAEAQRFAARLGVVGIEAEAREYDASSWAVWVHDEDQVATAEAYWLKRDTMADPSGSLRSLGREPLHGRPAERPRPVRTSMRARFHVGGHPVTWALIAVSVVATIIVKTPGGMALGPWLSFSNVPVRGIFPEIRDGEVWRLLTPMFLHGSPLHLFFNMLWLHQLGGDIERREDSLRFCAYVGVSAVVCHVAQYLVSGPFFIGMSGVMYALFGYVWMMARYDARHGYVMETSTVYWMVGWAVFCLTGLLGNVANTQHFTGLALGVVGGWLRSGYWRSAMRRRDWRRRNR